MRRRLGGSWKRRWHRKGALCELGLAIVVLGALLGAERVQAQGAANAPRSAIALSVERCEGLPFDAAAYERVLAIELRVLDAQPGDAPSERQLFVRSPGCNGELEVSLRIGERSSSELLRASDYTGVGQPRALALATIETLRVLTARLQAAAASAEQPAAPSTPVTSPAEQPAAPVTPAAAPAEQPATPLTPAATPAEQPATPAEPTPPPAEPPAAVLRAESSPPLAQRPEPPRKQGSFELYAGVGAGLFDTLDWQVDLGGALALTRTWWLEVELAYGQASDETALGSVDASALTLAVSLEARPRLGAAFELSFGAGLRGGAAWASADSALPLREGAAAKDAFAPVLLAFAELGIAYEVADGLIISALIEPGFGIEAAQFLGSPPAAFDTENAASQRQPEVSVLGPGLYGGLTLGYRF
jgi:hypothetical protein